VPIPHRCTRPATAAGLVLLLIVPGGCRNPRGGAETVIAVVTGTSPAAPLAIDDVARTIATGHMTVRIMIDTEAAPGEEQADDEISRAERIVATAGLSGVVGHLGSRGSLAAAPVYNRARVVQLVPTATSRLLHQAGPWTFLLSPDDSLEGAALGRFASEVLGARQAVLLYVPDEYGRGLRAGVLAAFRRRGINVIDDLPVSGEADLETLLTSSLKRGRPDLVVSLCAATQTGQIARIATKRLPGVRVLAGDAAASLPELQVAAGSASDSLYVASAWVAPGASEQAQVFTARFQAVTGRAPTAGDALTYDAILLLARAVTEAGGDRAKVRAYLDELGRGRPVYEGVTGPIRFDDQSGRPMVIVRLRKGAFEQVPWP
jgi:branched-chain amino acid transport system substrate-binding protein